MQIQNHREKIIIIDFGSQVTKLIARRIRELGVYSEIIAIKNLNKIKNYTGVKGIILSGGPATVTKKKFPSISKEVFLKNIPILGICYGLQLITKLFGGRIKTLRKKREFGRAILYKKNKTIYDSGLTIGYTKAFKLIKQEEILFDQSIYFKIDDVI